MPQFVNPAGTLPVLLALAVLAGCSKPAPAPEPVRAVRTVVVADDAAGNVAEFAAEVRARTESRLGFRVGGKMERRLVELGERVRAGQPLARLDPQDLRLGQEAARAAERAAQAGWEQAAADLERFRELRKQGFISAAELERRERGVETARAQLDQQRAQAGVQGNQAAYAVLTAPAAGVVTLVEAEPGAVLAAGSPVLRLAHDGPRDAVFSVPEDRIAAFRTLVGQPGALRVRAWGQDSAVPATLRELAAAADPTTRTFLAKADIGGAPLSLGQTASVLLALPRTPGVARLPLPAVVRHQGQDTVWVLDPKSLAAQPRAVRVAGAEGNLALVAGLAPGERVVTAGAHLLVPGQVVRLWQEPVRPAAAATPAAPTAATAAR